MHDFGLDLEMGRRANSHKGHLLGELIKFENELWIINQNHIKVIFPYSGNFTMVMKEDVVIPRKFRYKYSGI